MSESCVNKQAGASASATPVRKKDKQVLWLKALFVYESLMALTYMNPELTFI